MKSSLLTAFLPPYPFFSHERNRELHVTYRVRERIFMFSVPSTNKITIASCVLLAASGLRLLLKTVSFPWTQC